MNRPASSLRLIVSAPLDHMLRRKMTQRFCKAKILEMDKSNRITIGEVVFMQSSPMAEIGDRAELLAAVQTHCRARLVQGAKTWTVVTSSVGKIDKAAVCQIVTNP